MDRSELMSKFHSVRRMEGTFGYFTLISFFTSPIVLLAGSGNVATYGKSGARVIFLPGGPAG